MILLEGFGAQSFFQRISGKSPAASAQPPSS